MSGHKWLIDNNLHTSLHSYFKDWSLDEMKGVITDSFRLIDLPTPYHEKVRLVYLLSCLRKKDEMSTHIQYIVSESPLFSPSSPLEPGMEVDIEESKEDPVPERDGEETKGEVSEKVEHVNDDDTEIDVDDEFDTTYDDMSDLVDDTASEVHRISDDTGKAWKQITNFLECYNTNMTIVKKVHSLEIYCSKLLENGVTIEDIPMFSIFKDHNKYGECIIMTPTKRNQTQPLDRLSRYSDLRESNWGFMKCTGRSFRKFYSFKNKTYADLIAILDFVMPY